MSGVSEYFAFIQPIRDNPDDETARLAYTDWLDERGDPRAEYLRTEAAWLALQPSDGQYRPLYRDLSRLVALQDPTWFTWVGRLAPLARRAWERVPVSAGFEPSDKGDLPREWGKASVLLSTLFSGVGFENRFCVPADYVAFLCAVGSQSDGNAYFAVSDSLWGLNYRHPPAFGTERGAGHEERTTGAPLTRPEVWVHFGDEGYGCNYFLCCDLGSPRFGVVAEGEDSHPWDNGAEALVFRGRNLLHMLGEYLPLRRAWTEGELWPDVPFAEWATY